MPISLIWFSFFLCKMDRRVFHRILCGAHRARELLLHWLGYKWHYYHFEITPLLYHYYQEQQQRRTQMLEGALYWDFSPCCSFKLGVSVTCLLPVLLSGSWAKLWCKLEAEIKVQLVLVVCVPFWWPWKCVAAIIPSLLFLIALRVCWYKATTPSYLV